uniref:Selenide, water dikinase n=1 Tax=Chromera velia CCMP2878 TaxID=1169474 RepID=A0A0G4GI04_9ALVE|eukprot:Cvel_21971.t1-p1 / transcript=Cvel_21971.t1 / gene=Cvel_21971 / organism=Chromera_velia_CCMP2878 / gene_product=Selenide, water dikinase, putative / transcript_product=Selenide, water dikinase, putative / location=Cvel_scaffold2112:23038-25727(-) / protein_length=565 / sequence_SO=supercontig / SO=protein_coding / is_pseudo=false
MYCVGAKLISKEKESDHKASPNGPVPGTTQTKKGGVKLTEFASGLGCACKLPSSLLTEALDGVKRREQLAGTGHELLVGNETKDDCSVLKLSDDLAIVNTVDFFPPIVDDPYDFGRIAAANALSDVYAMGAEPLTALSVCTFCADQLPPAVLSQILQGANDVCEDAGIRIGGGHTLRDAEPKFGLAVTGRVHPSRLLRNCGAVPGDSLVLTKPLGLGVMTRAAKLGLVSPKGPQMRGAVGVMTELNAKAANAVRKMQEEADGSVHAMTDVTGFGLVGHLSEMLDGSGNVRAVLEADLPVLAAAKELLFQHGSGVMSGGAFANCQGSAGRLLCSSESFPLDGFVAVDPQTSGGLLVAVEGGREGGLLDFLQAEGVREARVIGRVVEAEEGRAGEITLGGGGGEALVPFSSRMSVPVPSSQETESEHEIVEGRMLFVSSDAVGSYENDEDRAGLGVRLVNGALQQLALKRRLPEKVVLVGSGALIAMGDGGVEGDGETARNEEQAHAPKKKFAGAFQALKDMEALGVEVLVCVTCVDWFKQKVLIGRVVTSVEVTELLSTHDVVTLS